MATNDIPRVVADFQTQLSTAISVGSTSFSIASATDEDSVALPSGTYCFTIEKDSTNKEYLIGQLSGTDVTSVKTVSRQGAESSGAARVHRIGSSVVITDYAVIQRVGDVLRGALDLDADTPLSYDAEPSLSGREQIATVGYVLDTVTGGTVTFDKQIFSNQTAGETIAAGEHIYFKISDQRWYLVDADLPATFRNVLRGIALGSGTAGNTIADGVQTSGPCDVFSGLSSNIYYASNTAGAISSTSGTNSVIVGWYVNSTTLLLRPDTEFTKVSTSAGSGDAGAVPMLNSSGKLDSSFTSSPVTTYYTASGTYTKSAGVKFVDVEVLGAGAGGSNSTGGGGGGAGAYAKKRFAAADLASSETVTVGAGGSNQVSGGTSSFGSHLTCTGGTTTTGITGGVGGIATGGDLNISGQPGGPGYSGNPAFGGTGGDSLFGFGGTTTRSISSSSAGGYNGNPGTGYGSGGGGAVHGSSGTYSGGAGSSGLVTVTEYFN